MERAHHRVLVVLFYLFVISSFCSVCSVAFKFSFDVWFVWLVKRGIIYCGGFAATISRHFRKPVLSFKVMIYLL